MADLNIKELPLGVWDHLTKKYNGGRISDIIMATMFYAFTSPEKFNLKEKPQQDISLREKPQFETKVFVGRKGEFFEGAFLQFSSEFGNFAKPTYFLNYLLLKAMEEDKKEPGIHIPRSFFNARACRIVDNIANQKQSIADEHYLSARRTSQDWLELVEWAEKTLGRALQGN